MAPTTMKCPLPNVHELFLYIVFSFSGYYSSQQLSQNTILLTTIKFFSRLLCKIQGFQGFEFGPIKFKAFQCFQDPIWTLCMYYEQHVAEITLNYHITTGHPHSWWAISISELKFRILQSGQPSYVDWYVISNRGPWPVRTQTGEGTDSYNEMNV